MRDYSSVHYSSEEQRQRYERWREQGYCGENRIYDLLTEKGYHLRYSSVEEDMKRHADFINIDTGETIDVKNKSREFWLELKNYNGNDGWLFTGADIIIQCFSRNSIWRDSVFMYRREDMVEYYKKNPELFRSQYCKRGPGKSVLWALYPKRLSEMDFVTRIH